MDQLNQRQMLFCDALLAGASAAEAYRRAGYRSKQPNRDAAALMKNASISAHLAAQRKEQANVTKVSRERALELLACIAEDNKGPGMIRIRAIESLARMEGWFHSAQERVDAVAFEPLDEVADRIQQVVLERWGRAEQVNQVLHVFGRVHSLEG